MMLKIRVSTPKGCALSTARKLRPFWGMMRVNNKVYGNAEDDTLIWVAECTPRQGMAISRNVGRWAAVMHGVMKNKAVRKAAGLKLAQEKELDDMLFKGTQITVIHGDLDLKGFTEQTAHF